VVAVGCGSGSGQAGAPAPSPQRTFTASPCPTPATTKPAQWSAAVPADLPKPPHATITESTRTPDGVQITKFTTPSSLRDGVLFVVGELPKAGYVLGRGDAEISEADAPFVHGDIRGLVRLLATQPCSTLWLLATVKANNPASGGSPLLPTHSPSGTPSALPFG
jgi:hypothetical protein